MDSKLVIMLVNTPEWPKANCGYVNLATAFCNCTAQHYAGMVWYVMVIDVMVNHHQTFAA